MRFQLDSVSVHYEKIPALKEVSCVFESGETVLITGPTGAGKTTLMRLLYLDIVPTGGNLLLDGQAVSTIRRGKYPVLRRRMGIVFQDCKLLEERTIYENVIYPLFAMRRSRREAEKRCLEVLADVGISFLRNKFPRQLSGGEKRLVALARSIVHEPEVLIADEPTGSMDERTRDKVLNVLQMLRERGRGLIVATHEAGVIEALTGVRHLKLHEGHLHVAGAESGVHNGR